MDNIKRKKVKRNEYGERMEDEESPQATRYHGWSCQGIARYNQLFNEIRAKWGTELFEHFEDYVLTAFKTEEDNEGKRKGKRQKIDTRKQLPDAHHELWDDDVPARTVKESNVSFPSELGMLGETAGV